MIPHLSERTLILAPHGRDARLAASILGEAGLLAVICDSLPAVIAGLAVGAGCALMTEEGLLASDLHPLARWLDDQPEWSDFPFVLLTRAGGIERNPAARRHLDMLGNVTFLERPFHPTTLISLVQSALRGRRRQYEARSRLEELRRGAERYRNLFESIEAGFCVLQMVFDAAGAPVDYVFIEANPAFARQTGLQNPIGKSMRSMIPDHEQHWFDTYGAVALTGEPIRFENHAQALGDIWYDVYAFRVGDPAAHQVAALFYDISDRREMEAAVRASEERLRRLNETLEDRVVSRTRELELAQEALRQSQKLESMGQLTGGVAHDFNNLLTPIVGSLDLLLRRGLGSERERRLIEGAVQSADRAKTLVQRLLAFARRQPLQPAAIGIGNLVREMADLIASTCGPRIRLDLAIAEDLPAAHADANQIEMALLNLAVNARDAMPDGGVLTISADRDAVDRAGVRGLDAGTYVRLSVTDTGIGMDGETVAKAIEPFFTTKGIGQGTGLGLSMVHGLAAQLGGGLSIDSMVGEGTTINLWLPISHGGDRQVAAAVEAEPLDLASGVALVVDDEDLVRASTASMLEELGYQVVEARSGDEALAMVRGAGEIDLLVTDHLMPGLTGTDLADQVSRIRPDMRVLVVSGYAELDGIAPDLPRLTKPFKQTELAATLARLWSRASA